MFNNFIAVKKQLYGLKALIKTIKYSNIKENDSFVRAKQSMDDSKTIRDNVLDILSNMDAKELLNTFIYLGYFPYEDKEFENEIFQRDLFKYLMYELVLCCLSNLLQSGQYELFHSILAQHYYASERLGIGSKKTFFDVFGITQENTCNISEMARTDDSHCVYSLLRSRANNHYSSIDELITCDLIVQDTASIIGVHYFPYAAVSIIENPNMLPKPARIISKILEDDSTKFISLFGFTNKEELIKQIIKQGKGKFTLIGRLINNEAIHDKIFSQ